MEHPAVKWYRKAAEQGHALAQSRLAFCYGVSDGVPRDYSEAYQWWLLAAAQGDDDAKYSFLLGFLESLPPVSAKLKEPRTNEQKFEAVVESAEKAAVLVLVQGGRGLPYRLVQRTRRSHELLPCLCSCTSDTGTNVRSNGAFYGLGTSP